MAEQFTIKELDEVIVFLREYVKRGDRGNLIADVIGKMFAYACQMRISIGIEPLEDNRDWDNGEVVEQDTIFKRTGE